MGGEGALNGENGELYRAHSFYVYIFHWNELADVSTIFYKNLKRQTATDSKFQIKRIPIWKTKRVTTATATATRWRKKEKIKNKQSY